MKKFRRIFTMTSGYVSTLRSKTRDASVNEIGIGTKD